jgi:hypothetical protein
MARLEMALETCKIVEKRHARPITIDLFVRHYAGINKRGGDKISPLTAYNLLNELFHLGHLIRLSRGNYMVKK